jgi:predicted nuclease of predicted toxin-antitoxin system
VKVRALLLDQMLDSDVASELEQRGFDVLQLRSIGMSRADDEEVLKEATRQKRILVTLDEHFGDWAVLPLSRHPGVIRVKADPATASNILKTLMPFLQEHSERSFADTLIIVSQRGVRWVKTA